MKPLRVTFYSYKGGVGRSLALLNVGVLLARRGHRVVLVDFDLEAPGLGLSEATRLEQGQGASDVMLDWLANVDVPIATAVHDAPINPGDGALWFVPAGTRPVELAKVATQAIEVPDGDQARVFELFLQQVEDHCRAELVLIDSRTGLADISGVCTVALPDVVVLVSGLNEQNVQGTAEVLRQLVDHPAREKPPALLSVWSPVPREGDLEGVGYGSLLRERMFAAKEAIYDPIQAHFEAWREVYGEAVASDLVRGLFYDPAVPLVGELLVDHDLALVREYEGLTDALLRLHPGIRGPRVDLAGGMGMLLPELSVEALQQ